MKKVFLSLVALTLLSASCNPFAKPSIAGVSKTVNGGADWQFSNLIRDSKNGTIGGVNVSVMGFDPIRRETLYVASYDEGLYKSEDSAATWTKVLSKIQVYDFAIHPADNKKIYAAGYYGGFGKLLVTKDNGATWNEIYNEESENNPVRAVALNPANPNQVVIGTSGGNIVRSNDEGVSWQLVKSLNDRIQDILWKDGNLYVLTRTKGFYKGADTGTQFDSLTNQLTGTTDYFLNAGSGTVRTFYQIYADTQDVYYITTDRGLYRSSDAGKTWQKLQLPIQEEGQVIVRGIAAAKVSSNIIYTSVGSTIYKSVDGGKSWQTQKLPTTAFVNYLLVDPNLPQITYAGLYAP